MTPSTNSQTNNRVRLSREELLAGKCFPDEKPKTEDPRIKSPDSSLENYLKPVSPLNIDSTPLSKDAKMAMELKRCHDELAQWKDYKDRIEEWKREVYEIFRQLKEEAAGKQRVLEELKNAHTLLKIREEQIKRLTEG